jgi:IMP dehydrogenase
MQKLKTLGDNILKKGGDSMPFISNSVSRTFSEYVILPGRTRKDTKVTDVDLKSRITHDMEIPLPFMSAAMQSVTGHRLAISLALHGGLGVLPCSITAEEQAEEVKKVKRYRSGFVFNPITTGPDEKIGKLVELQKAYGYSTFPVVAGQKLVGLITEKKYHPKKDADREIRERMISFEKLIVGQEGITLEEANEKLFESGIGVLPVIDGEQNLKSVVFYKDLRKHVIYPDAFVDPEKRLRVAAAVSTHPEDQERARLLVSSGADFLVVDSSDLFSDFGEEAIAGFKSMGVPVIAGNIIDAEGYKFLANLGVDAVKIGQGSGSTCTTRRVKSTGRGQATAVMECARARDELFANTGRFVPVISDGGIDSTGDMAIAFAVGADTLMMGKYFAGFTESPTQLMEKRFRVLSNGQKSRISEVTAYVKPYWGEASARAKNIHRYGHKDPRTFVIEGEEGFVAHKGMIEDRLPSDILAVKSAISGAGFNNLADFHRGVKLEMQSGDSFREGGTNILT